MKDFLIKLLGGMTREQHLEEIEHLRQSCEQFAKDYLCAKNGVTLQGDGVIEYADCDLDFVVTGSRTRVNNCNIGGIYIAPWVELVSCIGLFARDSNLITKNERNTTHSFVYAKEDHLVFLKKSRYSSYQDKVE